MEKHIYDKAMLYRLYIDEERTMREIGDMLGVSAGTVLYQLKKHGIKRDGWTSARRKKRSEYLTGRPSPLRGKKFSVEHVKHMSESKRGHFLRPTEFGGHRKKRPDGYIKVYVPAHPSATKDGYMMEHILVMEKHIGRYLGKDEVVHHKNHNREDNRIENLQLMTFKEHAALHMKERWKQERKEK